MFDQFLYADPLNGIVGRHRLSGRRGGGRRTCKQSRLVPIQSKNNTAPKLSILVETSCWLWNHILARRVPSKIFKKCDRIKNIFRIIDSENGCQHVSPEHLQRVMKQNPPDSLSSHTEKTKLPFPFTLNGI